MKKPQYRALLSALVAICLYATVVSPVQAQLNFTLLTPNASVPLGETYTFQASLTNTSGAPIYLNNDFGLVDNPLVLDDLPFQTQFLLPSPQPTLFADGVARIYDLFTVSVPTSAILNLGAFTLYSGSFTLYGGPTDADQTTLGRQDFTLTLRPAASAVPEPGALTLLIGLGISGIAFARRNARSLPSLGNKKYKGAIK